MKDRLSKVGYKPNPAAEFILEFLRFGVWLASLGLMMILIIALSGAT